MEYWRRLNYLKLNQGLVNNTSHSVMTSGVLKSPTSTGEDSYIILIIVNLGWPSQ